MLARAAKNQRYSKRTYKHVMPARAALIKFEASYFRARAYLTAMIPSKYFVSKAVVIRRHPCAILGPDPAHRGPSARRPALVKADNFGSRRQLSRKMQHRHRSCHACSNHRHVHTARIPSSWHDGGELSYQLQAGVNFLKPLLYLVPIPVFF